MQWLLHGTLAASIGESLTRHGHVVHQAADAGLGADAGPADVIKAARTRQWDLFTDDPAVALAPFDRKENFSRSIVLLQLGPEAPVEDAVDRLFERFERLSPKRLYTVTPSRVKVRQLP